MMVLSPESIKFNNINDANNTAVNNLGGPIGNL